MTPNANVRPDPARSPSVPGPMIDRAHVRDGLTAATADANHSGRSSVIMVQNLQMTQVVFDDAVVVTVAGDVDLNTADQLETGLNTACLANLPPRELLVDLSGVAFLGAVGLTSLVIADHRCQELGVAFRIVANHRAVLRPLEITGLSEIMRVVPTFPPHWARQQHTTRASRAIRKGARRILLAHRHTDARKSLVPID